MADSHSNLYLYFYKIATGELITIRDVVLDRRRYATSKSSNNEDVKVYAKSIIPYNNWSTQVALSEGRVFSDPYHNTFNIWFYEADEKQAKEKIQKYCTELFTFELKTVNKRKQYLEKSLQKLQELVNS